MFRVEPLNIKIDSKAVFNYVKISSNDDFCVMPKKYVDNFMERIKKFKVYEDDIWLVTFPRCGTTWAQEMLRLLCNNFDYEKALKSSRFDDFPFLE